MSFYRPSEYKHNPHWRALRTFLLSERDRMGFADYSTGRQAPFSPGYATENAYYAAQLSRSNQNHPYNMGSMQPVDLVALERCTDATNYPQGCAVRLGVAPAEGNAGARYNYMH